MISLPLCSGTPANLSCTDKTGNILKLIAQTHSFCRKEFGYNGLPKLCKGKLAPALEEIKLSTQRAFAVQGSWTDRLPTA